jgi:hypothetical protein
MEAAKCDAMLPELHYKEVTELGKVLLWVGRHCRARIRTDLRG